MSARNLRLKAEIVPKAATPPQGESSLAQCWVDNGVAHLDGLYAYLIPGNLNEILQVGSLVAVDFNGRETSALIKSIGPINGRSNIKSISKALGTFPLASPAIVELIEVLAQRFACHPFDIVRSALPGRVASVEKLFNNVPQSQVHRKKSSLSREFLQLPPHHDKFALIAEKLLAAQSLGSVIALLPEVREVKSLAEALVAQGANFIEVDTSQSKSVRYENFLKVRTARSTIVIGTRTAVFSPLDDLASIFILNDGSEHFYERRAPGWNVRDVALIRGDIEKVDLFFIGYAPSIEIAALTESGEVRYRARKSRLAIQTIEAIHGELIPSRALPFLRKALQKGSVLALVPAKGYAQAIRCAKCRTISRCECGGALEQRSATSKITCAHCRTPFEQWRCAWCQHQIPSISQRGIERHQQEIAALFPSTPTFFSTADHSIEVADKNGIYLCTPGMQPHCPQGYSAILILEGNRFLSQSDMRASERVRELFMSTAALAIPGAPIIAIQDQGEAIATTLASWNPIAALRRELAERETLNLPPYVRVATLTMALAEISRFKSALLLAQSENRIPESASIYGPIPDGDRASVIIVAPLEDGNLLISTIHEFIRRRSAAKKDLPTLRIDPYSLSV
jgi:primosomal protein N' (replication factor Y)